MIIDANRNTQANQSQAVQSHFAETMRRIRIVNRQPSEVRSFSLTVPAGLNRRKLYALVDCWTALDAGTWYWWFKSTVTALSRGVPLQTWPLQVGMLNNDSSGFVDYLVNAFSYGSDNVPDSLRLVAKQYVGHIPMPTIVHPLAVNLDCDEIRWDFTGVNPPFVNQSINQARVFLACRSEI